MRDTIDSVKKLSFLSIKLSAADAVLESEIVASQLVHRFVADALFIGLSEEIDRDAQKYTEDAFIRELIGFSDLISLKCLQKKEEIPDIPPEPV